MDMNYFTEECHNTFLTPYIRKYGKFCLLAAGIYLLAVLTALRHPFCGELEFFFSGTFLERTANWLVLGAAMLLSSYIPMMISVMVLGWVSFHIALSQLALLFWHREIFSLFAILMVRFAYIFALLLCGLVISWKNTKAVLRKQQKGFLLLKPREEPLRLLGWASAFIGLIETLML